MDPIVIIVGLVALILIIWWITSLVSTTSPMKQHIPVSFKDMTDDFESYPRRLWLTSNIRDLSDALKNSPYCYTVIESDGTIIYSNRNTKRGRLIDTFEVVMAIALGEAFIVREGCRNAAMLVSDSTFNYRVVHISSPI
jgi:hypothetical protein